MGGSPAEEKFEQLSDYLICQDDVLVTTMGTIGRAAVAPQGLGKAIFDSHLFRMRIDQTKVCLPYLCFALNGYRGLLQQLEQKSRGAIMDGLNTTILKECTVPLPPLSEQQRIAGILEKADRLRRLRRYAQQVSETFLQTAFVKMFVTNEQRSWSRSTVADLVKPGSNTIRTGPFGSQLLHSEFIDRGVAVLGIDNVVENRFQWGKARFITEGKYRQLKRYTVFPGDVLITIMATTGRCAVVPDDIPLAINTKHLCCITLDQEKVAPTYLKYCFLNHPRVLYQMGVSERGAIMPGLNMQLIKDLVVPVPPKSLQQQFVSVVRRHERLAAEEREAERQAEHLFQTLLQRAFAEGGARGQSGRSMSGVTIIPRPSLRPGSS